VKGKLPIIRCDTVRVTSVFQNLILNGIKYNDSPEKIIEIGFTDDKKTVFYVRDNGIGIAPEHHELIFRLFKRLNGPGKYGEGTGAGLTFVKKIIERHGGKIWVESSPGCGTTFYFTL
jgi:signal transduction histidine kinase